MTTIQKKPRYRRPGKSSSSITIIIAIIVAIIITFDYYGFKKRHQAAWTLILVSCLGKLDESEFKQKSQNKVLRQFWLYLSWKQKKILKGNG